MTPLMDAHYDQVMKKRAEAGNGTRLYFAYSTILDRSAFLEWRSQHGYDSFDLPDGSIACAQNVKLVFDFPSRFWGGRVAGLADASGGTVWGKVFEISEKDWPIIQHKEGAITGMCVEKAVQVKKGDEVISATAFATNPSRASNEGAPSQSFLEAFLRGAKSAELPASWLEQIKVAAEGR